MTNILRHLVHKLGCNNMYAFNNKKKQINTLSRVKHLRISSKKTLTRIDLTRYQELQINWNSILAHKLISSHPNRLNRCVYFAYTLLCGTVASSHNISDCDSALNACVLFLRSTLIREILAGRGRWFLLWKFLTHSLCACVFGGNVCLWCSKIKSSNSQCYLRHKKKKNQIHTDRAYKHIHKHILLAFVRRLVVVTSIL